MRPRPQPSALLASIGVALALAAPAGLVRAAEASLVAADAAFTVRASPARLKLGEDRGALLDIETPPEVAEIALSCSAGSVERVERLGPGRFRARYLPPQKRYPQLAIVSAVGSASGRALQGSTTIALWGQGDALIRTRAFATVSVRIGEELFGPAKADAGGVARVPIVVPPGVREGYDGKLAIDLGLPRVSHVHLAIERTRARADRAEELVLWAYAVTATGERRAGAPLLLEADRGEIVEPREIAPGVVRARWVLASGLAGTARAAARLEDEPRFEAAAVLELVPGPATRLEIAAEPEELAAGETLEVRVTALDAAGNRAADPVALTAGAGVLREGEAGPGELEATLEAPGFLDGRAALLLEARAGAASTSRSIALVASAPAAIAISPAEATLVADGTASLTLSAGVLDRFGNPVPGARLDSAAALGRLEPAAAPASPERSALVYFAPRLLEGATDTVELRAGALRAASRVVLEPAGRGLVLAPKVGLARVGPDASLHLGAEAGWLFDRLGQQLGVHLELGHFGGERVEQLEGEALSSSHRCSSLMLSLTWRSPFRERWLFWAGAGIGAGLVSSAVRLGEQPEATDAGAALAAQVVFGVGRRMWRGGPFLEGRLLEQTGAGLDNVSGRLSGLIFDVGYRFEAL